MPWSGDESSSSAAAPGRRSARGGRRPTPGALRAAGRASWPVSTTTFVRPGELARHEQVDAERLALHLRLDPLQVDVELLGAVGDGAEHAAAAGIGDGGDDVAAVAEAEDRNVDADELGRLGSHDLTIALPPTPRRIPRTDRRRCWDGGRVRRGTRLSRATTVGGGKARLSRVARRGGVCCGATVACGCRWWGRDATVACGTGR